jgi:hypothetical protein
VVAVARDIAAPGVGRRRRAARGRQRRNGRRPWGRDRDHELDRLIWGGVAGHRRAADLQVPPRQPAVIRWRTAARSSRWRRAQTAPGRSCGRRSRWK